MSSTSSIPTILSSDSPLVKQKNKNFLQEGLSTVQQATVEDQRGNIEEAVQLYSLALELFQKANEQTTSTNIKDLISKKSKIYEERMEHLTLILLQSQFPEVPEEDIKNEDDESSLIEDLEKQFADIPVSDNGFNFTQTQRNNAINLDKLDQDIQDNNNSDNNDAIEYNIPIHASPSTPSNAIIIKKEEKQAIPQNPEVVKNIDGAAKWITRAKDAELAGDILISVEQYRKGLSYLYKAYKCETDRQIRELVRIKYNCLVSRVDEIENSLAVPSDIPSNSALAANFSIIQEYTNKARKMADNFDYKGSVKYYNMAMTEIKKTLAREDVVVCRKWLAKRALVTERRIGGISAVFKVIQVALPYPWSKIFGIVEFGLKVTGVTGFAQKHLDKKLSKLAGIEYEKEKKPAIEHVVDLGSTDNLNLSKSKKKKNKK